MPELKRSSAWTPYRISAPSIDELVNIIDDYRLMNLSVLDAIVARYDGDPGYPFIDTKLNTTSGEDFDPVENIADTFKGKQAIYIWIQGRGLEALVEHTQWLQQCRFYSDEERRRRIDRLRQIINEVTLSLEKIRRKSGNRLFFCMTPAGDAVVADEKRGLKKTDVPDGANFSHLFYAKGLLASAWLLNNPVWRQEAISLLQFALQDIENGSFVNDNAFFYNPATLARPICHEGPWMIAIGALVCFYEKTREKHYLERGRAFYDHLVDHHINLGRFKGLEYHDYIDAIDSAGLPFYDQGKISSSPGHALEAAGLLVKLFKNMKESGDKAFDSVLNSSAELLPSFFLHNFELGYNQTGGGIQLSFDLLSRRVMNGNMPWWPLPEAMRAASGLLRLYRPAKQRKAVLTALMTCCNDFMFNYVNPDVHLMAIQMRDEHGKPLDRIPATPDADPGYHTGLSVIDFIADLEVLKG
ncbi:hypothetical protein GF407_11615 [candidate division KSB1 bacterium]|nr:hypothetical protein [candidate division KSB1 bacterium]